MTVNRVKDTSGLLVVFLGIAAGVILGIILNEISGIRRALERNNAYNDAGELMVQCYHEYGYCTMEWRDDRYVITPEPMEWKEEETTNKFIEA